MVSAVTQKSAIPAKRTGVGPVSAHFGASSSKAVDAVAKIAHIDTAKWIQGKFAWAKSDIRVGGLSLEDMAGRLLTLIGIYIPQGYFAIKDEKHPWETNGRNAVVWLMTIALTSLTKSENYGVNTVLLNPLMQQKGSAVKFLPFLKPLVDPLRMDLDYLTILENSGINISAAEKEGAIKGKKALWASSWLDANKLEKIQNRLTELTEKSAKKAKLSDMEKHMLEAIPSFFKRINTFNFVSVGIITAATVYFIGGVAMRIVNKVFSPLDKDYDGPNAKKSPGAFLLQPGSPPKPSPLRPPTGPNYGYSGRFIQRGSQGGLN